MNEAYVMHGPPGPETIINGVPYLYFGGTSYLGLAAHPEVIEAGCRALRDFGVHSATTRAGFGTIPPVQEVERCAAEFFGTEDAFYFASGYVASHILTRALAAEAEALFVHESTHYSGQEAVRLPGLPLFTFRAEDSDDLSRRIRKFRRVLVMADAVGPVTGALAPVTDYLHILRQCESATLLLDDAHGFGVLGPEGRGLLDQVDLWPQVNGDENGHPQVAVCGTLAKAFGGFGGIIPGSRSFVSRVRANSHYYAGASAPAAPVAGATAKALEIARKNPALRERLRSNARRLRSKLQELGLRPPDGDTAHFGLGIGSADNMRRIHAELKNRGILLPYLEAYAGTPPEGLLRFAVFADHTEAQIDRLVSELHTVL